MLLHAGCFFLAPADAEDEDGLSWLVSGVQGSKRRPRLQARSRLITSQAANIPVVRLTVPSTCRVFVPDRCNYNFLLSEGFHTLHFAKDAIEPQNIFVYSTTLFLFSKLPPPVNHV
jgi:hypothetical protein